MIRTTLGWTVKNLKSMYDKKNTLRFDHPIQRQSGQWEGDRLKKSLLIHSILAGYPVPAVYCLKEAVDEKEYPYSVLDGKQRLTTIFDYIDGRYPLDDETPPVVVDDETYEIGGLYFNDMPSDVSQELLRFKFQIYGFEDADDELIEEIFFRLNNSTPLSKPQKAMPLCGVKNARFIKSLLSDKFFSEICRFSALQKRKSDDMCTLLQAMMLLDARYSGYEYTSISADEVMRYASHIRGNYSEDQQKRLYDIIDYLERAFPVQDKMMRKINIPIVMLCADTAMGKDYDAAKGIYRVGPMYFRQWFSFFFAECYGEYGQYCSSGGIKKEKVLKRIELMEQSLREYFELDTDKDESTEIPENPDPTADNIENTETILAADMKSSAEAADIVLCNAVADKELPENHNEQESLDENPSDMSSNSENIAGDGQETE